MCGLSSINNFPIIMIKYLFVQNTLNLKMKLRFPEENYERDKEHAGK